MGVVYFSIIPTFEPSRYCKCWIVCFYYTNCRKCAVISPYEIKRFRKKDPMSYFINILHWRDWSTFYVYLDSGKINDGKNSYEGGINESIFRGKIAQWGVTFDDVNMKKVKPWEEIL